MTTRARRLAWAVVVALGLGGGGVAVYGVMAPASSPLGPWNATDQGVAISGYDAVAYFTEGKAVQGTSEFEHVWQDATWHFSSAEHRDLFASDPERYAPEFGGFCALAMSYGTVAKADPEMWAIVEGKLYLNYNEYARETFHKNLAENIAKADTKWADALDRIEQDRIRAAKIQAHKDKQAATY